MAETIVQITTIYDLNDISDKKAYGKAHGGNHLPVGAMTVCPNPKETYLAIKTGLSINDRVWAASHLQPNQETIKRILDGYMYEATISDVPYRSLDGTTYPYTLLRITPRTLTTKKRNPTEIYPYKEKLSLFGIF